MIILLNFAEVANATANLWSMVYTRWFAEEVFSSSWFVIAGSMILIYTILILFIDKSRLREIFFYGSLLAVAFNFIEMVATNTGLLAYKTKLFPFISTPFPFTYTIHPIVHMLAYQYASDWRSFAVINTITTAFFAFIAQPIYVWAGVLWFGHWNYIYSFLLAGFSSTMARVFVLWLASIEQKNATETNRSSLSPKLQPAMKPLDEDERD